MVKLIFDISEQLNTQLEKLAEKRGNSKAGLSRWAITKLLEQELSNGQATIKATN